MANFHLEVKNIGRRKHKSLAKIVNYITAIFAICPQSPLLSQKSASDFHFTGNESSLSISIVFESSKKPSAKKSRQKAFLTDRE